MPALESGGREHGEAYRCSICNHNYPRTKEYAICPVCGDSCTGYSNVAAMPDEEAASIANHAAFERYYAEEHTPNLELTPEEEILVDLAVLAQREGELQRLSKVARNEVR